MKNYFFTLLLFSFFATNTFAQQQKYYRVQLLTNEKGLQSLQASGVTIDHGDFKKGVSFTSDFSEHELSIIKHSGIPYKVLIEDLSAYYVSRNNTADQTDETVNEAAQAGCSTYPTPRNFKPGSMGGYYTYEEMLAVLDSMAAKYPKLITVKQLVSNTLTTAQGRPLYYVKISDHPNQDENEPKILYTALHHAREPESLSQLIFYMWYLLEGYNKDALVKSLVDFRNVFYPMCKPRWLHL